MTPERWSVVKEVFNATADLSTEEAQERYLASRNLEPDIVAEVRRLMELGKQASGFLSQPAEGAGTLRGMLLADPTVSPGDVLAGRFEIQKLLGMGGMGTVFLARDRELGEQVALKTVRAGSIGTSERLLREVQAARRVASQHVCKLFDLGRHDNQVFFTMEYLEGETLTERLLRAGRFTAAEWETHVPQILAALSAAHEAGVLHRDLKPSNIILTTTLQGQPRAVVTDFGLARVLDATGSAPSTAGPAVGTRAYMAPETVHRGEATVASDIYSLGMVLDECVPRPGSDPRHEAAIEACLQFKPDRRPGSIAEVIQILQKPQVAESKEPAPSRRQWLQKYAVPTAIFSVGGVSLLWLVNRLTTQEKIYAGSLLLNTVQNHTGDERLNGASHMLEAQLAQSATLRLVPAARVTELLQRMGQTRPAGALAPLLAREVALRNGPGTAVAYGVLSRISSTLRLDVRIEQPGTRPDEVRASLDRRFEASGEQDLLQQIRAAAVWIRESAGETEPDIRLHNQPPGEQTTPSWDALAMLERARVLRAQGKMPEAEAMLREALRLDPGFSTAMRELADMLVSMARLREGFAMWKQAVDSGRSRMLNTRERFRLEAAYLDDIGDLETAESTLRLWMANYEADFLPRFYLSNIRIRQYRPEEALTLMQEAAQREPGAMVPTVFLAMHLMVLERNDEALQRLKQLEQAGEWIESRIAASRVLASMGRLEEAEAMARRAIDAAGGPGKGHAAAMVLANILVEAGRDDAADAFLTSGAEEDLKQGRTQSGASKLEAAAYLALRRGQAGEAGQRAKRVLDLGDPYRELAAVVLARSRNSWTRSAVQLHEQWKRSMPEGLPRFERLKSHLEAEILLAQGRFREAADAARRLAQWDSAWFWSDCLPRCLEAAGLKQEADKEFSAIASRKRYFWHVTPRVPGLLRDCVAKTLK